MTDVDHQVTAELVWELIRDQHPDLAERPIRLGARGWDNQLWRLISTWILGAPSWGPPAHAALRRLTAAVRG